MFTPRRASSITKCRSVRLSSIAEDSRLQPPVGVWAVLSPILGGRALTPPTRHRLGRPLPCQLSDRPQANLQPVILADTLYPCGTIMNYPTFRLAIHVLKVCTYVLLSRSPLSLAGSLDLHAGIHVTSVHPELGSNSQIYSLIYSSCFE